jgi:hypothetical protein
MVAAGSYFSQSQGQFPLPTMQSMRTVDAECVAEITHPDFQEEGKDA